MVNVNINFKISDAMADSLLVTKIYVNEINICNLSSEKMSYFKTLRIDEQVMSIKIKCVYQNNIPQIRTKNPLKIFIAYIILFVICVFSKPEPLECPYEYEAEKKIFIQSCNSTISVCIDRNVYTAKPRALFETDDVVIDIVHNYSLNKCVLEEFYKERKKVNFIFFIIPSIVLFAVLLFSIFINEYVTTVFLSIIILIFLVSYLFSKKNLVKQYKSYSSLT